MAGREIRRELDDRKINGSTNVHEWPIGVGTRNLTRVMSDEVGCKLGG